MNRDQLLDAIGMVDEQKIQDALMIKRTKRISGLFALSVVLFILVVLILLFHGFGWLFHDTVIDYVPSHIAQDIDNANVVTILPDPADYQSRYTIVVPDDMSSVMHFQEWSSVEPRELDGRESLLILNYQGTKLVFYDGGYVRAQKHDWDDYIGAYRVPEGLWREVLTVLADE